MNATCDFELENKPNAISLPVDAIKEEGTKTFVMLVKDLKAPMGDAENQVKREVKLGSRGDERVEVKSGLKAGDIVVLPAPEVTAPQGGGPFG